MASAALCAVGLLLAVAQVRSIVVVPASAAANASNNALANATSSPVSGRSLNATEGLPLSNASTTANIADVSSHSPNSSDFSPLLNATSNITETGASRNLNSTTGGLLLPNATMNAAAANSTAMSSSRLNATNAINSTVGPLLNATAGNATAAASWNVANSSSANTTSAALVLKSSANETDMPSPILFAPSIFCDGLPDGLYPFKNYTWQRETCDKFVLCAGGIAYPLLCPMGQVFNIDKNQCQMKALVEEPCGLKPAVLPHYIPSCAGKKQGELIDDSSVCRKSWMCGADGTAVLEGSSDDELALNCSIGYAFSAKNNTCLPADLVDGCAPPKDITLSAFCKAQGKLGLFADPLSCNRGIVCLAHTQFYYVCGGWPTRKSVRIGRMFFSPRLLQCVDQLNEKCAILAAPARRRRHSEAKLV